MKHARLIIGLITLIVASVGLLVALNVSQTPQDIRQKAVEIDVPAPAPTPVPTPPPGTTLTVCPTGTPGQNGCDYIGGDGIQQAIDNAVANTTILIKNGTYGRTSAILVWNKVSLTLIGESLQSIIKASGPGFDLIEINNGSTGITVENLTLQDAVAAIYVSNINTQNITISNNRIENNIQGIYSRVNNVVISNNEITGTQDAAIAIEQSSQVDINHNTITGNGDLGIYFYPQTTQSINIHHNLIAQNSDRGILLNQVNGPATIDHNTIATNAVSGVQCDFSNCSVTNNISFNNVGYGFIADSTSSFPLFEHNIAYNNTTAPWLSAPDWPPPTNLTINPQFINPAAGDYHLQLTSPACSGGENGTYIGAFSCTPGASPTPPAFAKGDVNHDGVVNAQDVQLILTNLGKLASQVPGYFDAYVDNKINTLDFAWWKIYLY